MAHSRQRLIFGLRTVIFILFSASSSAAEITPGPSPVPSFQENVEKEFSLRSGDSLRVVNARGDIIIDGWAQDRLRVKATKNARVSDANEANRVFGYTDLKFTESNREIELVAEYGKGLDIEGRLKERSLSQVNMDLTLFAPSTLPIKLWAVNGKVILKNWNASVEIRAAQGWIEIENVKKNGGISVFCPECDISVKSSRSSLRCLGGKGTIAISDVSGPSIYVESGSGAIHSERTEGQQLYVTQSGSVTGDELRGRIEFQTRQGTVTFKDSSGFLSGRTETGTISAQMNEWEFQDKALVESVSGNISLILPSNFSAEVDLRSGQGKVYSAFPLNSSRNQRPEPPSSRARDRLSPRPFTRLMGIVRDGGEQLELASEVGNVSLLSGP